MSAATITPSSQLDIVEAAAAPWANLETLFGTRGACGGCWCMAWRCKRRDYEAGKGELNRERLKTLWRSGRPVGLLGYRQGRPVAWCSVAPRSDFAYFETTRSLKPIDALPAWAISCLFVAADQRRQGLARQMVVAAADHAFRQGAPVLEAYPVSGSGATAAPVFIWTGVPALYEPAGFRPAQAARSTGGRTLYRLWPENARG